MYETDTVPASWKKELEPAHVLWVPSQWQRRVLLSNGFRPEQVVVVPEPVDASLRFNPQLYTKALARKMVRNSSSMGREAACSCCWAGSRRKQTLHNQHAAEIISQTVSRATHAGLSQRGAGCRAPRLCRGCSCQGRGAQGHQHNRGRLSASLCRDPVASGPCTAQRRHEPRPD
jgi:hypothetical protein